MVRLILALIFSVLIFGFGVRPLLAQVGAPGAEVENEILNAAIGVRIESIDGYSQIIARVRGKDRQLTNERQNHTSADREGKYVVYVREREGGSDILRFDLISNKETLISNGGYNQKPRVNKKGQVVWQKFENNSYFVNFFDGSKTSRVIEGINPDISSVELSLSRKNKDGEWIAETYDLSKKRKSRLVGDARKKLVWAMDEEVLAWSHTEGETFAEIVDIENQSQPDDDGTEIREIVPSPTQIVVPTVEVEPVEVLIEQVEEKFAEASASANNVPTEEIMPTPTPTPAVVVTPDLTPVATTSGQVEEVSP